MGYPCESCCSTGLGLDQESCWDDEKFTRESCCGSGFENSHEEAIGQKELDPRKKFRDTGVPGEGSRKCPKRNCPQQVCDFGYFKDKNGCDTCKCNDDRMSERPRYKN